jgi:transposase
MQKQIIGVDIAKASFMIAKRIEGSVKPVKKEYPYKTAEDVKNFIAEYEGQNIHFVMEFTSIYHKRLAYALLQNGFTITMLDSKKSYYYGQIKNRGTKTDKTDAVTLLEFGEKETLQYFALPTEEAEKNKQKRAHLERLEIKLGRVKNQLHSHSYEVFKDESVKESLEKEKAFYEEEIFELQKSLNQIITSEDTPTVKKLMQINGIGKKTAVGILTCVKSLPDFAEHKNSKKLAKFVGLAPSVRQSGKQNKKGSLTSAGQRKLRSCLYMGATAAVTRGEKTNIFKEFFIHLQARGKSHKEALVATMHKILRIAFAVIKTGKPFDADYLAKL